ncbi:hypothetical protein MIND_00782600 [Mycena indigotica]|uniref:F-box domain-containing protein n=1 Tax=Mycena indigotica TaxID=2126181 RepID=A0A8H6SPT3_9AGAR|nr:uncharacterized protein MIND_00782600 [Mycena indigotica]KAF7302157.1 hypothetical protein MIND_00782600 [Mycena indigotica]
MSPSPEPVRFEDLDDDILIYITNFALHPDLEQVKLFDLSRRMRNELFPYIHELTIVPDQMSSVSKFNHIEIAAELRQKLPLLPHLNTFYLGMRIEGGLWTELVECLAAAPNLTSFGIFSPWSANETMDEPWQLADELSPPPLQMILYPFPIETKHGWSIRRRHPLLLDFAAANLRRLLSACHTTLDNVELLGELFLGSFDTKIEWTSLRELFVIGFWPEWDLEERPEPSEMLSVLELLPNLRTLVLLMSVGCDEPEGRTVLMPRDAPAPQQASTFLAHLNRFDMASLTPIDRILNLLPAGLESLTLTRYPAELAEIDMRQPILPCVELLAMLAELEFPGLKTLHV